MTPEVRLPTIQPDTIRRLASEIVGADLRESDLEALLPLLTMVLSEAAAAQAFDRAGWEPRLRFVLEEWPR